jgi:glycosyltransferase involved in cell wall biosynthesis
VRILQLIASIAATGGGPIEGIRQLAALGAPLGIATTVASLDAKDGEDGVVDAAWVPLGRGFGKYRFQPGAVRRIQTLTEAHDVTVVNGIWQYHALAAHRALAGRRPYVVFPHGMLDPWFNHRYPLKAVKKRLYWRWGVHPLLRDAAAVCFTAETERLLARTSFTPYAAREAVVAYGTTEPPPATDAQRAAFRAVCPDLGDRPYLLFLSRIQAKKGCDLLIEAFAACAARRPGLLLVMAGPDQDGWIPGLRALAARLGVAERIRWPGMLRGDAKWGAFHGAEAFCLPSHQENFGIAVAEALACGKPVLISDQVNIWREVVADGAGLAAPDTAAGCRELLERWCGMAETARSEMRSAARDCFQRRYRIDRSAASLFDLLRGVCAGRLPKRFIRPG